METKNFIDCRLAYLEKTFQLKRTQNPNELADLLNAPVLLSEVEQYFIEKLRHSLTYNIWSWNEQELSLHFIGPLFTLVDFSNDKFGMFAQRTISATINNTELTGKPDGVIAAGYWEPEVPFFCFHEYKKEIDNTGDPAGQCLAAMLVGQALNTNINTTIYGCYVVGRDWYFMTLHNQVYAISNVYAATTDDIVQIFAILKKLKQTLITILS